MRNRLPHLSILAHDKRAEMLQRAVGPDLKAVDVGDEGVRRGRRGDQCGEQGKDGFAHDPPHSIVAGKVKR